jgi:hypothetical protein
MLESIFECQSGKIWGIRTILRSGTCILGENLCFFGFLLPKNETQLLKRLLGKVVIVDSFLDCSSSLIRGNWIRFDLLVPAGAPQVVASILEGQRQPCRRSCNQMMEHVKQKGRQRQKILPRRIGERRFKSSIWPRWNSRGDKRLG